mmetsp:Transcript_6010/g.12712  ORF Transcript_6010/g.12712 Transcript_6010/m.12712 type:complete len:347 (+) Transcript_6010:136-1176(+)
MSSRVMHLIRKRTFLPTPLLLFNASICALILWALLADLHCLRCHALVPPPSKRCSASTRSHHDASTRIPPSLFDARSNNHQGHWNDASSRRKTTLKNNNNNKNKHNNNDNETNGKDYGHFDNVVVKDSNINSYYAGCLVRWPVKQLNNTFAYGGYGSILSKGTLMNLFRPLHCDFPGASSAPTLDIASHTLRHPDNTADDRAICRRLSENNVGEKRYFRNGWNLVQLMYAYVNSEKFVNVDEWTTGFCMHSDWVLGYFANYYNVSRHVEEAYYKDVAHARIEPYKGSELYAHPGKGFCKQDKEKGCRPDSEICHRVSQEWMMNETERWRVKYPTKFRNVTANDSTL